MNKIKSLLIVAAGALGIFASLPAASTLAIDCSQPNLSAKDAITCGSCDVSDQQNCLESKNATSSVNHTLRTVINLFTVIVGIVAVIMLIIAGFRYITSSGNDQAIAGAKQTILYAIIGLVVVVLAQVIVRFVLHQATSTGKSNSSSSPGLNEGQVQRK